MREMNRPGVAKCFKDDESPNFSEGRIAAYIIEDGIKYLHHKKDNLIVNNARKIMSHMIGDCEADAANFLCINQFRLGGDNSLTSEEMLTPNEPAVDDTDIVYSDNLFIRNKSDTDNDGNPLMTTSYPNSPNETSVMFTIKVLRDEANLLHPDPTVYTSAGLFAETVDGSEVLLYASQTFPVMTKISNREFIFE